ncbi:MAG: hypothetical protein Q7V58_08540 [Actinomycetota bacterium]|nr:hypothetical protein [Actinomycetota bacterium]
MTLITRSPKQAAPRKGPLARAWDRLDDLPEGQELEANGRQVPGTLIIAFGALLVGLIAVVVTWRLGGLLLYSDAQTHMVIARRVIDSQNTGFQQLGTVWLPVPHILLLPFVQSFPLWQSGLAGGLLGAGCLAVSASALWRIAYRVGYHRRARLIVVAVLVFNPAMLYITTTALTEPVLLACLLAAVAGLSGWIIAMPAISPGELAVFAGLPTALAVLSRYEGWAFVAVGSVFVTVASWRRWRSASYTLSLLLSYLAAPVAAIVWWLSYNYVRYGDPLDFARGQYSAATQQADLASQGLLATKGNLGLSVTTYNWTVENLVGLGILVLAAVGLFALLWTRGLSTLSLLILSMGFVYPFALLSLWLGQTVIRNEVSLPIGMFNVRYGLVMLPISALLVGAAVDLASTRGAAWGRATAGVAMVVIIGSAAWSLAEPEARMGVIREGYINDEGRAEAEQAANWLGRNYQGGYVLIDEVANPILMDLNLPLDQLWASFNGENYEDVLADPYQNVNYVFARVGSEGDRVWTAVSTDPNFNARFYPVFEAGPYVVWQNTRSMRGLQ